MTSKPGRCVLPFPDRRSAGRLLAERLTGAVDLNEWTERTVVLGLPRGGVAVAKEVAAVMGLPMDVIVTRKIGYPPQPELGVGAIAEGLPGPVYDARLLDRLELVPEDLAGVVAAEEVELDRRVRIYRGGRPPPPVAGWCAIVVDDGLATGGTARAALRSLRSAQAGAPRPRGAGRALLGGRILARRSRSGDHPGHAQPVLIRRGVLRSLRPADRRRRPGPAEWLRFSRVLPGLLLRGPAALTVLRALSGSHGFRRRSRGACGGGAQPSARPRSARPRCRTSPAATRRS